MPCIATTGFRSTLNMTMPPMSKRLPGALAHPLDGVRFMNDHLAMARLDRLAAPCMQKSFTIQVI